MRATSIATTTVAAAAADAAEMVRIPTCAASQAITMPGRTVQTTDDRTITKDLRASAATATTAQKEGLGHLLGDVLGIEIGITIEIK